MKRVNRVNCDLEQKRKVVNNAIKICVTCGNIGVKIDSHGIYCNDCDSKFQRGGLCLLSAGK